MYPDWYGYKTHAEFLATSQAGKTKLATDCCYEHILAGNGFTVLDYKRTLYQGVLNYLAYVQPKVPVILLTPSKPDFVVPFNPFLPAPGANATAHATRMAEVVVKALGSENIADLQTYRRLMKMVILFCAATGETIQNAVKLLFYQNRHLSQYAASVMPDAYMRLQWQELAGYNPTQWEKTVLSTRNRLDPFIFSDGLRRFTGIPASAFSIKDVVQKKAILLVDLAPSEDFPPESARIAAGMLLSEFLSVGLENANNPIPHFIYADECQEYINPDVAPLLDMSIQGGLRLTLIHHHAGQFDHFEDKRLVRSLETNARIKAVFQGLDPFDAKAFAEKFWFKEANQPAIKRINYRRYTHYELERYQIESESESSSEANGFSAMDGFSSSSSTYSGSVGEEESEGSTSGSGSSFGSGWNSSSSSSKGSSVSRGTRYAPREGKEVSGIDWFSREDTIAILAERLIGLAPRQCYIKLPDKCYFYEVPWVEDYADLLKPSVLSKYMETLREFSLPSHEADRIIKEHEDTFLERSRRHAIPAGRNGHKKPAYLHAPE